ncbi:MAG: hypothetical protein AAF570_07820, partial [Bacteroidota bacterium]
KTDCYGNQEWLKKYDPSTSQNNVHSAVRLMPDSGYVFLANMGQYQAMDMLIVRVDKQGNTVWRKFMAGLRDDVGNGIAVASDGGVVIVGQSNSYGADASGSLSYYDYYAFKLDANGNTVWSTAVGNQQAVDRAYDIRETSDGGYVISGQYLHGGTFYCSMLKLDANGNQLWHKAYGRPNHSCMGVETIETSDGGYLLTGSTTILKTDFSSFGDILLIKTDSQGDTMWVKVYEGGGPDLFENGSSVVETPQGYLVSVATASYPTTGFVPNKYVIFRVDLNRQHQTATGYNKGGSHFPVLREGHNDGYFLAGFTNWTGYGLNGNIFQPLIIALDADLNAACFMDDLTSFTTEHRPGIEVANAPGSVGTGVTVTNWNFEYTDTLPDSTICEVNPPASCTPPVAVAGAHAAEGLRIEGVNYDGQTGWLKVDYMTDGRVLEVELVNVSGKTLTLRAPGFVHAGSQDYRAYVGPLVSGVWYLRVRDAERGVAVVKPFVVR